VLSKYFDLNAEAKIEKEANGVLSISHTKLVFGFHAVPASTIIVDGTSVMRWLSFSKPVQGGLVALGSEL
jgi:hypothetical protein